MSYTPGTDFIALLRSTGGGVRTERMPGLDYVIAALARSALISVVTGQTAPVANQATTVWFKPAIPSWTGEGTVFLWNATAGVYQVATAALWSLLIAGPFISLIPAPATAAPLADGAAAVGVSLLYARQDHVHPTDPTLAPLASPALTGNPTAPTQTIGDNTTKLATTAFVLANGGLSPPVGSVIAYGGNTAPTANWQLAQGQAISRTTFAALFALYGITYGSGDGITTFNLPDLRGRVIAGVDGGANRLTTATMSSQALAGVGGVETKTLVLNNVPTFTPAGNVSVTYTPGALGNPLSVFSGGGSNGFTVTAANANGILFGSGGGTLSGSFTGTAINGGGAQAFGVVQPTMELQYLIRVS